MRTYIPGTWEITTERYIELRAFCRQYPQWKVEADNMLGVSAVKMDDMPHGTDVGDPTGRVVERREKLVDKMRMVEKCAAAVSDGKWQQALMLNVCNGTPYEVIRDLHPEMLRTNNKNHFFKARRIFFNLLDKEKEN